MSSRNVDWSTRSQFRVAPSILSADFANLKTEMAAIQNAGADWVHVDVMDGHFVPNLTIGPPVVKSLRAATTMPLDCHLMIENPEKYIPAFVEAGADVITIHIETVKDPAAVLKNIRALGCRSGITLRPATSVDAILPFLPDSDLILLMTVNPGFSGQKFMSEQIAKIKLVKSELKKQNLHALIEVDGGITDATAIECLDADVLVAGNFVFKNSSYAEAVQKLKKLK